MTCARFPIRFGGQTLKSAAIVFMMVLTFHVAAFAIESPKLSADQSSLLEDTRAYALQYTQRLPDFICAQTTRREVTAHMSGSLAPVVLDNLSDVVEEQLSYVGGKEKYVVLTIDGKKAPGITHAQLDGAISWGEFGSLLSQIFDPASHAIFSWDREERVNGRRGWAYKYHVPKESGTTVIDQSTNQVVVVSYSGRVIIDPDTKDVLEVTSVLDVPGTFRIRNVTRKILYGNQDIAGKQYCLPLHSELQMERGTRIFDNRIDFKDYHHFSSNSTIHFDSPNPQ